MKRIAFVLLVLLINVACKKNESPLKIAWQDNFESYSALTFPDAWKADGNGSSISNNYIDDALFFEGEQSLKLYGVLGSCWAAIAYHSLDVTSPYEIEIAVRNGDESLSGCNQFRGWVGLNQGTSWTNSVQRYLILFNNNGKVLGAGGKELCSYNTGTWYVARVRYELKSTSELKLSYWIDNIYRGSETISPLADENLLNYLEIQGVEGSAWFDDVIVYH